MIRCNFASPLVDCEPKHLNSVDMQDLLNVVDTPAHHLTDFHIRLILDMVLINVERSQSELNPCLLVPETSPPPPDPSWIHLSLSYQILLKVVQRFPSAKYFRVTFFRAILRQIGSSLSNEREAITSFIVASAKTEVIPVAEMLNMLESALIVWRNTVNEIYAVHCVLSTFLLILKNDRKGSCYDQFFQTVVLPSIESPNFGVFQQPFCGIVLVFAAQDPKIGRYAVEVVMKWWPRTICAKQAACLRTLMTLLPFVKQDLVIVRKMMSLITTAIDSPVYKVALAATDLVCNRGLGELLVDPRAARLRALVIPPLKEAANSHWNADIRARGKLFFEAFARCEPSVEDSEKDRESERVEKWRMIAEKAQDS
jgi:hypothetical protein